MAGWQDKVCKEEAMPARRSGGLVCGGVTDGSVLSPVRGQTNCEELSLYAWFCLLSAVTSAEVGWWAQECCG